MLGGLKRGIEFGDRQTPLPLARKVCDAIARSGFCPASILEPTCGTGSFLLAAVEAFAPASHLVGCEVNPAHVEEARSLLAHVAETHRLVEIRQSDFFQTDWSSVIAALPEPILIIGNPPWGASKDAGAGTKESRWLWKLVRDYVDTGHAKQGLVGDVCYHFLRLGQWLVENNTAGVVAMVLNNSFVDAPTGSRLRRVLLDTFDKIQVVDLGGNARRHEKGNVFGVRVGVALLVLTRNQGRGTQEVEYTRVEGTVEEKLEWLRKL